MRIAKSYTITFVGRSSAEAHDFISTYYIDGGGEDMIKEELSQRGIIATRVSWSANQISFHVKPKEEKREK